MHRRTFLASCGVTAAIGLAGCGDTTGGPGADTDEPSPTATETTTAAPSIVGQSIETTKTGCGSPEGEATVSFAAEDATVGIEGAISAATPCHEATLAAVSYDAGPDTLTVRIGTESDGSKACVECLGRIEYAASITFEGVLPGRVVVRHGDGETTTVADVTRE